MSADTNSWRTAKNLRTHGNGSKRTSRTQAALEPDPEDRLAPEPDHPIVLMFCPMCGELAPEAAASCPACGEPLPDDPPKSAMELDPHSLQTRRFRRRARWLGLLWIWLAYSVAVQDIWMGGHDLPLPPLLQTGKIAIPEFPLTAATLNLSGGLRLGGAILGGRRRRAVELSDPVPRRVGRGSLERGPVGGVHRLHALDPRAPALEPLAIAPRRGGIPPPLSEPRLFRSEQVAWASSTIDFYDIRIGGRCPPCITTLPNRGQDQNGGLGVNCFRS